MAVWESQKKPLRVEKVTADRTLVTGATGHEPVEGSVVSIKILNATAGTIEIYDDNTTVADAGTLVATIVVAGTESPKDLGDMRIRWQSGLAIQHDAATRAAYEYVRGV